MLVEPPCSAPESQPVVRPSEDPHRRPAIRRLLQLTRALHTYLSMLALTLLFFFSVTGFMLNHEDRFGLNTPRSSTSEAVVPPEILRAGDKLVLVEYLRSHLGVTGSVQPFDLPASPEPIQLTFKSPRGQTDIEIAPGDGKSNITTEFNGLAAFLANLHKAKNAGAAWRWVLDATAILLFMISVTGFVIWYSVPSRRTPGIAGLVLSLGLVLVLYFAFVP